MSLSEIVKLVGKRTGMKTEAAIRFDGLFINIQIKDARQSFGRVDVLVTPLNGKGEKWVAVDSLREMV